jgi:hypothetical protein
MDQRESVLNQRAVKEMQSVLQRDGGLTFQNIREVIAFPKTQSGSDPMTNAPTPVSPAQLNELGIRLLPPPAKS